MREAAIDLHPFFAHVPTHSNLGDDPSRGRFNELERLGAKRTLLDDSLITMLCTTDTSPTLESRGGAWWLRELELSPCVRSKKREAVRAGTLNCHEVLSVLLAMFDVFRIRVCCTLVCEFVRCVFDFTRFCFCVEFPLPMRSLRCTLRRPVHLRRCATAGLNYR